jgi:hypothetical protein
MAIRTHDQISRPAGRIHGNQSGIRLGIGRLVLPGPIGDSGRVVGGLDRFLSRYLNE